MSPPLRYLPAYLGLFAAQVLAVACNAFLDIQYGGFSTEVLLWACAFAITLRAGWRQNGEADEKGRRWMRNSLIFGALISVVIFIPMWGFPRAGLYMLAMLQVAYNCVTTTRRHLHMSLLISLVMVLFAASHYRADWTMLFYLVPYVAAVVFTLVAEQINRRAGELHRQSLGQQVVGAQGTAIIAATSVILVLGLLFYALTPQTSWMSLAWRWGLPGSVNIGDSDAQLGGGGAQSGGSAGGQTGGSGGGGSAGNAAGSGMGLEWPSAGEMRKAAARKGMPEWQRDTINGLADLTEGMGKLMKPVFASCVDLWESLKKWLKENRDTVINMLIILGVLALLYALWRLMREARMVTWLRTRFDYFRLVLSGTRSGGVRDSLICYEAMVRLFELQNIERGSRENTREYLNELNCYYRHLGRETGEMTRLYEDARYGGITGPVQAGRMRELYRQIFRHVG
ncbi:MAG: hypothetical protein A2Z95_06490 [Gallionellales bacterium GWA2_60_18]|nr:MAG: hypothetical protein A2Z95_06490 [Gallionellales bacterium GWA2_60_18]